VIFCPGCNFNCWYCHNRELIKEKKGKIDEKEVLDYLKTRCGLIDAVVISGGEASLQPDLFDFIDKCKRLGFKIKLDTNGSDPDLIKEALKTNRLDFIAMDVKCPLVKYTNFSKDEKIMQKIRESINIIQNSNIDYEFRTTFEPMLSISDIEGIAKSLGNVSSYAIQKYRPVSNMQAPHMPHGYDSLNEAFALAKKYISNTITRN